MSRDEPGRVLRSLDGITYEDQGTIGYRPSKGGMDQLRRASRERGYRSVLWIPDSAIGKTWARIDEPTPGANSGIRRTVYRRKDGTMPKRKVSKKGITILGNPGEVTLHEAMEAVADWLDYEADVVENAADEIDDPDIAEAAEDQAEAMREASDELEDAADAARETAAEVFTDTGEPSADKVGDSTPEGDVIGGNPISSRDKLNVTQRLNNSGAKLHAYEFVSPVNGARWYGLDVINPDGSTYDSSFVTKDIQELQSKLEWWVEQDSKGYLDDVVRGNPDELPIETNLPPETPSIPDEPPRALHWYKRPIGRRS